MLGKVATLRNKLEFLDKAQHQPRIVEEDMYVDPFDFVLNLRDDQHFKHLCDLLELLHPNSVYRVTMDSIVLLIDVRPVLGERLVRLCGLPQDAPVSLKLTFEEGVGRRVKPKRADFLQEGQQIRTSETAVLGTGLYKATNAFIERYTDRLKSLNELMLEAEAKELYERDERVDTYLSSARVPSLFQICVKVLESGLETAEVQEILTHVSGDLLGHWETNSSNVLVQMYNFVKNRLVDFASYCVNCGSVIAVPCFRPSVCDNPLCTFQFNNFGMGRGIKQDVVNNPGVIDLLLSFFGLSPDSKTGSPESRVLAEVPPLGDLVPKLSHSSGNSMSVLGPYFHLLLGLFVNNKCLIEALSEEEKIQNAGTEHQFLFFSGSPSNAIRFRAKQNIQGSIYGLYGKDIDPSLWHSILGRGLGIGAPVEEKTQEGEIKMYTLLRARQAAPGTKTALMSWPNTSMPVSAGCKILLLCEVLKSEGTEEIEELNWEKKAQALAHTLLVDWEGQFSRFMGGPPSRTVDAATLAHNHFVREGHNNDGNLLSSHDIDEVDLLRQCIDDLVQDQGLKTRNLLEEEMDHLMDSDEMGEDRERDRDAESETRYLFREIQQERFDKTITEKYFVAKEEQIFSRYLFYYPQGIPVDLDVSKMTIPSLKL